MKKRSFKQSFKKKKRWNDVPVEKSTAASSDWQITGDLAIKDAVFPPAARRVSREQLDGQAVAARTPQVPLYLKKVSSGEKPGAFTSLQKACLRQLAANIGLESVLEDLSEGLLPPRYVQALIKQVQRDYGGALPFFIWKRLVQAYDDLPLSVKSYEGLVVDDVEVPKLHIFDASFSSVPRCNIVTLLDLSNTGFRKEDIWKIRPALSNNLVALCLDRLILLDDDSIVNLTRDAGEEGAFQSLEILTLRGCNRITDQSVSKLAFFPRLKVLDLRETSCAAPKSILRRLTRPPFFTPTMTRHLRLFSKISLVDLSDLLQSISLAPFAPDGAEYPRLPASALPPSVIISNLTRLDEAKLRDPRQPIAKNDFMASHPRFGNVYTTRPIDANIIRTDGNDCTDDYDMRAATVRGRIEMAQVDLSWKRGQVEKPKGRQVVEEEEDGQDNDSECDMGSDISNSDSEDDSQILPAFYRNSNTSHPPHDPIEPVPERNELMLLRFFKESEAVGERLAQPKRKTEFNDQAPLQVKRKVAKTSNALQELLGRPAATQQTSLAPVTHATISQPGRTLSRPPGIKRSIVAK